MSPPSPWMTTVGVFVAMAAPTARGNPGPIAAPVGCIHVRGCRIGKGRSAHLNGSCPASSTDLWAVMAKRARVLRFYGATEMDATPRLSHVAATGTDKYADPASLSRPAWRDGMEPKRAAHRNHRYSAYGERPKGGQTVGAGASHGNLRAGSDQPASACSEDLRVSRCRRARSNPS